MNHDSNFNLNLKKFLPLILVYFFIFLLYIIKTFVLENDSIEKPLPIPNGIESQNFILKGTSHGSKNSIDNIFFTISKERNFVDIVGVFPSSNQNQKNKNPSYEYKTNIIQLPIGKYYISYNTPSGFITDESSGFEIDLLENGEIKAAGSLPKINIIWNEELKSSIIEIDFEESKKINIEKYSMISSEFLSDIEYNIFIYSKKEKDFVFKYKIKNNLPTGFEPSTLYKCEELTKDKIVPFNFTFQTNEEGEIIKADMTYETRFHYGLPYSEIVTEKFFNKENPWLNNGSLYFKKDNFDKERLITVYDLFTISIWE